MAICPKGKKKLVCKNNMRFQGGLCASVTSLGIVIGCQAFSGLNKQDIKC